MLLRRLNISVLVLSSSFAYGQNDYNYDDFSVTDGDLETFNDDAIESNKSAGVEDFPASKEEDFNYGGVENFSDDEQNFDEGEKGLIDFGDDEPVGKKIDKPVKKKNKAAKSADADQALSDENTPTAPLDTASPTVSDSLNSGSELFPVDQNPAPSETLAPPADVSENMAAPVESPYAPLPEDTMAPPAPNLPEPNEFAGAPAVPGSRRIMAIGEAPEQYSVRAGDTLFDICDQLLDEPNYWPKLWALNPKIRNPHFIYPGIMLRFYPGDDDVPPYLEVVKEQDVVPIENNGIESADLITEDMANVLFDRYTPKVSSVQDADKSDVGTFDIEDQGVQSKGMTVSVVVPAFYFSEDIESLGQTVGDREGWHLTADGGYFLIESDSGLSPGTIYTIVRPVPVPDVENIEDDIGYRYDFVAAAKVTRNLEDNFAEAKVVYTRLGVKQGDLVINYKTFKRSVSIANTPVTSGGSGTVIGFEYSDQKIGAQGHLVFLKGSYSANAVVPVFNDVRFLPHNEFGKDFPETVRPVATIRIIESAAGASLGYIMNSNRAVRLGDFTGRG